MVIVSFTAPIIYVTNITEVRAKNQKQVRFYTGLQLINPTRKFITNGTLSMFGKVENWLGELCAATDDEEGETDLLTYETFDSLIPNEQYENDEDKRSIINDVDSYFNVNRSRKYNVRHVNVRPAPRSETMPSEELDQEDGFDRREAGRQRCLREYNSPGLSVLKNNKSSEARKLESGHKLRKTSSVQKQEYFSNICRGNLFDPQEVTISSGFTKYRFPKSGRKYLEAKPEFSRRHSRKVLFSKCLNVFKCINGFCPFYLLQ